jgi:uncharacterized RDD family membrane protein YckC
MSSIPSTAANVAPVDLKLVIETPENVFLTYRLAGPAVRVGAYLVDLTIRFAALFAASMIVGCSGLGMYLPGTSIGMLLVLAFFLEWGYFAVSEGLFHGKTIGKHVFQLRVIQEGGYPITLWSALLRNLVRAADALGMYGVGFVTMLIAGRFRRLGDLVARTLVIEERRIRVPTEPIILERIEPLPRGELGGYIPSGRTLTLIEQYLGRRNVLAYRRGHDLAHVLARVLATKLRYTGDRKLVDEYPMAFLARVYATFYRVRQGDDIESCEQTRIHRQAGRRLEAV